MRTRFFGLVAAFGCLVGVALTQACAAGNDNPDDGGCAVGSETCPCTTGGACDPGLTCLSNICVNPNPTGGGSGGNGGSTSVSSGSGAGMPCAEGCSKVDVLFAVDHSGSMGEEIASLSASQSFQAVAQAMGTLNCGTIQYRIGLTDDNDRGFITPPGWSGNVPWFDSGTMTDGDIATAFQSAAGTLLAGPKTPDGCEHVLTSSVSLLATDNTGFLRPDALLVLVLVTDVDDYGWYDQGTVTCTVGGFPIDVQLCSTPPTPVATLQASLLTLKGNEPSRLASIVTAGDPNVFAGNNACNAPASCCQPSMTGDCDAAFQADRLYEFTGLLGSNGIASNICNGVNMLASVVQDAFANQIDLACQQFEPPK